MAQLLEDARQALLQLLEAAGLRTDATGTDRKYFDGVAYAVPVAHERGQPIGFEVVIAVNKAQPTGILTAAAQTAHDALDGVDGFIVRNTDYELNAAPLPGRGMPNGDVARLDVLSSQRMTS